MSTEYESIALSEQHDVATFDCGISSLNAWLAEQALRAQQAGTARTFVWATAEVPERVWAYFSLAPPFRVATVGLQHRAQLPAGQTGGTQRSSRVGYGGQVLVDALSRAARAADAGGGRLVIVDALDDAAASFYRHHDFTPVKDNPRRLVLKLANVRKFLEMPEPRPRSR